jgi:polyhydroxyalkanoate synthase
MFPSWKSLRPFLALAAESWLSSDVIFAAAPPAYLHLADETRRQRGLMLERLGFSPRSTPSRTVGSGRAADLLAYQAADRRPALLIVPAPIKAAYIWDLAPDCSAVRRLMSAGLQVYMARWRHPRAGDEAWGLEDYADGMIDACLEAIRAETRHGSVALEAPIEFGSGRLEAVLALAPDAPVLAAAFGNLPGTLLDWASAHGDPMEFSVGPWLDWAKSMRTARLRRLHWQVRRWSLDEAPMARRLFEQVAELLYRRNSFTARRLRVGGRLADPQAIEAPILAVRDPRSRLVPPSSVEAYRSRTGSTDVQLVDYCGDTGVVLQHVGVLVGGRAHAEVWPRVAAWLNRR